MANRRSSKAAEPVIDPPIESILEAVGNTPILKLSRIAPRRRAELWAKLELGNPAGSVKDRICLGMISAAERAGLLKPGVAPSANPPTNTVVEPTSGNTGVGLAMVCARKGYRLILTMPDNMSEERRSLLKSYGAELVLTPATTLMSGAIAKAKELAAQLNAVMLQQFENQANPEAHRQTTGPELIEELDEVGVVPDAFVAGVGTGGTLTGVGRALRRRWPEVRVIAVEPEVCAVLTGYPPGVTRIQGLGAGFVPPILDRALIDEVIAVSDEDAWRTRSELAKSEGVLGGISAGANVWAALEVARALRPKAQVVTVVADTGERYFSLEEAFR